MEWTDEDFVESLAPHFRYLNFGVDDAGQQMPANSEASTTTCTAGRVSRPDGPDRP